MFIKINKLNNLPVVINTEDISSFHQYKNDEFILTMKTGTAYSIDKLNYYELLAALKIEREEK